MTLKIQVFSGAKRKKDEVPVDSLDFHRKVLHSAWHPKENIIGKIRSYLPLKLRLIYENLMKFFTFWSLEKIF